MSPTLLTQLLDIPVETIGSRFTDLKAALPTFRLPPQKGHGQSLIHPAFTIAILAGIESCSPPWCRRHDWRKHRSNMELVGPGHRQHRLVLFGGISAPGHCQNAANVRNGGRTPVAGIMHSVTVMAIMMILMPLAS
jgi:SulP family sulfate permease